MAIIWPIISCWGIVLPCRKMIAMFNRKEKKTSLEDLHFQCLMRCIDHIEDSTESWEIEDTLHVLWSLADRGDLVAFTIYGLAYLIEGKEWYDAKEGEAVLRNAAEAGSPFAQYFYGKILMEGREDFPADPVSGRYWLKQSAAVGFRPAQESVVKDVVQPSEK